jgi:hypothetical protein
MDVVLPNRVFHDPLWNNSPHFDYYNGVAEQKDECVQSLYPSIYIHVEALQVAYKHIISHAPEYAERLNILINNYALYRLEYQIPLMEGSVTLAEYLREAQSIYGKNRQGQPVIPGVVEYEISYFLRGLIRILCFPRYYIKDIFTMSGLKSDILSMVSPIYSKYGFVWNGYFCFVNPNHPIILAMNGSVKLSPDTFELVNGPWSAAVGEVEIAGAVPETLNSWDQFETLVDRFQANEKSFGKRSDIGLTPWTSKLLIDTISSVLHDNESLALITRNPKHNKIPLPGFGKRVSVNGAEVPKWGEYISMEYYKLVYRRLYNTMRLYEIRNFIKLSVPIETMRRVAKEEYGINEINTPSFLSMSVDDLANVISIENSRTMLIRNNIKVDEIRELAGPILYQPNSVWIMDAVGTVHLFKESQDGAISPYPDTILPQTIEEIIKDYYSICKNKEGNKKGLFIYILEKLGGRGDLPANLAEIDKPQLCVLIEGRLKMVLSERDESVIRQRLPASYTLYREMCENRGSYELGVFINAAIELGLVDDVKSKLCAATRGNVKVNFMCQQMERYSLSNMAANIIQQTRDANQVRDMICHVIELWLDTVKVNHLHLQQ